MDQPPATPATPAAPATRAERATPAEPAGQPEPGKYPEQAQSLEQAKPEQPSQPEEPGHHEGATPAQGAEAKNIVVLASGSGTLLQALLDDPDPKPYRVAAVGSDLRTCRALDRADAAGVPTFTCRLADHADRRDWDRGLSVLTASFNADLVVLAGFMKLVGPDFLQAFPNRVINAHPSLLPAFPGMHAPADALEHGVKLTGCTVFLVDGGIDAGPIVAQRAVTVLDDDDAATLHERIKVAERELLPEVVRRLTGAPYTVRGRKVMLG